MKNGLMKVPARLISLPSHSHQNGCVIPPGLVLGQLAINQESMYAGCAWGPSDEPSYETLTVWAYNSDADRDADIKDAHRQDGRVWIIGPKFFAELDQACCTEPAFPVSRATVAQRIGGKVF